jgi:hypothetical protein
MEATATDTEAAQNVQNSQIVQISQNSPALLPLDQPRVIAIVDGKFTYTFTFARITQPDWEKYFSGISVQSRHVDNKLEIRRDAETALLALAESKLVKAEGYSGDFASRAGWQAKVPPRHMIPAARQLPSAVPSVTEVERAMDPENVEVFLDATWSSLPGDTAGKMSAFLGLAHRFAPPTVDHKRLFFRAGSLSSVVGGSRDGATIYHTRHKAMMEIYDDLIQGVDGYAWDGQPLGDPTDIKAKMDAFHKYKAVEQLFSGADTEPAEAAAA